MSNKFDITTKIGILDPNGIENNPLTGLPYSQTYKDLGKIWSTYPAYSKANEILDSISSNHLTFIISGTGSGKTVLIPKFALHYTNYQGKIAVTLPKRVVTLSAASFAAKTLDVELGKSIGYVYKGSPKDMIGPQNKIVYMTDGTLIMKFINDPLLNEYNVVIIDEAHERKVQIDLILLFLKKLLQSGQRPDLRVIIMSATIDGPKYQKYFDGINSKIINISGQPNYEIEVFFLDKPSTSYLVDGLDLVEDLVGKGIKKDMLFFITTSNEAMQTCKVIRPKYPKVYCIEVYADMDKDLKIYAESRDKFLELGNYDQKLIMATNVAESSLTIDGLKYVIDSVHQLYSFYDPITMSKTLVTKLITKAQALQRRGRVGRTETGICYHLVTKEQFDALEDYPPPDILKEDLTVDLIKIIEQTPNKTYQEGYDMLHELMDVPSDKYIDVVKDLFNLYQIVEPDGRLTTVGSSITKFSSLPLNRSLFLIYAYQLFCAKEASIILAMIDALHGKLSNLFYKADTMCDSDCAKPAAKKLIATLVQKRGDHFTFLNIYQKFKSMTDQKTWARKYGIRLDVLNRVDKLVRQYYYRILNISKAPQQARINEADTKRNLLQALKASHQHLIANKMTTTYPQKKVEAKIKNDSALLFHHTRKDIANKTFIYDELANINNSWEFNLVTLI